MARYYGVECATCHKPIALAVYEPGKEKEFTIYGVPLESIPCLVCGSRHTYDSDESLFFDGPDGLPLFLPT
jgi:hypothetical protein